MYFAGVDAPRQPPQPRHAPDAWPEKKAVGQAPTGKGSKRRRQRTKSKCKKKKKASTSALGSTPRASSAAWSPAASVSARRPSRGPRAPSSPPFPLDSRLAAMGRGERKGGGEQEPWTRGGVVEPRPAPGQSQPRALVRGEPLAAPRATYTSRVPAPETREPNRRTIGPDPRVIAHPPSHVPSRATPADLAAPS